MATKALLPAMEQGLLLGGGLVTAFGEWLRKGGKVYGDRGIGGTGGCTPPNPTRKFLYYISSLLYIVTYFPGCFVYRFHYHIPGDKILFPFTIPHFLESYFPFIS